MPDFSTLNKEISFKTSRSGGSGGQNVNKVATKVEAILNISESACFSSEEKTILYERLKSKLDSNGCLHSTSQEDRSQLMNKERATEKLIKILLSALKVQKIRKPTKIPKAVIRKRLEDKAINASKKETRKKPPLG